MHNNELREEIAIMDETTLTEKVMDATAYFKSLLIDIDNAKSTIDMEAYIYADDYFGSQVADAISRAVSRNVHVRILVDGIGTPLFHNCLRKMETAGAKICVFHPIPFNLSQYKYANIKSSFLFKFLWLFPKMNYRNHRKSFIIDKKIVYVGSVNIDQRHLSKEMGGQDWRDIAVKLTNIAIEDLQFAFNLAWEGYHLTMQIKKRLKKVNLNPVFRLNYTRHLRRALYKDLLRKISKSKTKIWVTSPYFNPDYFLLKKLIRAKKRGVDVRFILPGDSDVPFMKIVATTFYSRLLKEKIAIYEYLPSILHAKTLTIDDWYSVGSSNFNQRSIRHDLEVDACIQSSTGKQAIEKHYIENMNNSRQIGLEDLKRQTILKKMLSYMILFGRYFF